MTVFAVGTTISTVSFQGGDHACLSTCYVSCGHRSYDEPWLLNITSPSVTIIGLCIRAECPPRCQDFASPPHYRPLHWRRLQVRVVLQSEWLSICVVLPARSSNSGRPRALILATSYFAAAHLVTRDEAQGELSGFRVLPSRRPLCKWSDG